MLPGPYTPSPACAVLCYAGVPDAEASMMRHLHVLQIVMVSKQFVLALQLRPLHACSRPHWHLQQWELGCCITLMLDMLFVAAWSRTSAYR
jgi:hypothetical protein